MSLHGRYSITGNIPIDASLYFLLRQYPVLAVLTQHIKEVIASICTSETVIHPHFQKFFSPPHLKVK